MLQIKTFALPAEEAAANEFIKMYKPVGDISYNDDQLFIAWEDGTNPPAHQISDYREMIKGAQNSRMQQEIALNVMKYQIAEVDTNTPKWDELNKGITEQQKAMDLQDFKISFLQGKIDSLLGIGASVGAAQ